MRRLVMLLLCGLCLICVAPQVAVSQDQSLPKAEEVMDRYVEVTGGKEAYLKLKNRKVTGRLEIPAAGISGKVTIYQEGTKMRTSMEIPGIGQIEQFCDGKHAGEVNPLSGSRLLEGEELAMTLRQSYFQSDVDWRKLYPKAKVTSTATVAGKPCFVVELETPEGYKATKMFDQKTGLLVAEKVSFKGQMGDVTAENVITKYKAIDGVQMAVETKMTMLSQEIILKVDNIEHNIALPKEIFEFPESLKKLLGKDGNKQK